MNITFDRILSNFDVNIYLIYENILVLYRNGTIYNISLDGRYLKDISVELFNVRKIVGFDSKVYILDDCVYYYDFITFQLRKIHLNISDFKVLDNLYFVCNDRLYLYSDLKTPIFKHKGEIKDFFVDKQDIYIISGNSIYKNNNELKYLTLLGFYKIFEHKDICLLNDNGVVTLNNMPKTVIFSMCDTSVVANKTHLITYNREYLYVYDKNYLEVANLAIEVDNINVFENIFYITHKKTLYKMTLRTELSKKCTNQKKDS